MRIGDTVRAEILGSAAEDDSGNGRSSPIRHRGSGVSSSQWLRINDFRIMFIKSAPRLRAKRSTHPGSGTCRRSPAVMAPLDGAIHDFRRFRFGTGYFDAVANAISAGRSSTTAMAESTETAQF